VVSHWTHQSMGHADSMQQVVPIPGFFLGGLVHLHLQHHMELHFQR